MTAEEQKQETNFDHYKDDIVELFINNLAIVDDKVKRCGLTDCSLCCFDCKGKKGYECSNIKKEWLEKIYEKPKYKVTQFEYDLLQHFLVDFKFNEMGLLKEMKEKGHFKNINGDKLIKDIIENCEVIK